MARKSLKVEGMTASNVENTLRFAEECVRDARTTLMKIRPALPERDYRSMATHLDKTCDIIRRRIDVVQKSVTAETSRAEKKAIDAKIKEAMADPEKAAAIKELLNL